MSNEIGGFTYLDTNITFTARRIREKSHIKMKLYGIPTLCSVPIPLSTLFKVKMYTVYLIYYILLCIGIDTLI